MQKVHQDIIEILFFKLNIWFSYLKNFFCSPCIMLLAGNGNVMNQFFLITVIT